MTDDFLEQYYQQSLNQPVPYRKGKLWGYANIWGDILIDPQYDKVDFFYQTELSDLDSYRALVKKNGHFYVINKDNIKCSNQYKNAEVVDPYDTEFVFFEVTSNSNTIGVFFKDQLILEPIYDEVEADNQYIKVKRDDKYGLVDYNGDFIIPLEYDAIEAATDEEELRLLTHWDITLNGETSRESIVNNTGIGITGEDIFDDDFFSTMVTSITKESNILNRISNGDKHGVLLIKSNKTIKPEYDAIEVAYRMLYEEPTQVKDYNAMGQKVLFIVEKEGKFGLIDEDSNVILPTEMDSINNNGYDVFKLERNQQKGMYNHAKKALFFTDYDEISFPEFIDLNAKEDYRIYKIKMENGDFDYIGENGIKYYEN
ncbi:WG repeat-containing protein [uncultured Psychroserpens sp.]|uniref:WG repeat-containing protein n=1 Tax=uncultured Psychroserpens sp. TaxID=255436 RepID=UPI002617F6B6|nr:WG repeat-containing protein [uncultured Psychroserpens sp.]